MGEHVNNGGSTVRRKLPSHPSSAGEARRMVRRVLTEEGREDLVEPAQLLVSEVVTNALVHSPNPIDVAMQATEDGVLVEVADGSPHLPQPRHYAATANTGRGLALLEHTADAWGVIPGLRGKTVWFQLSTANESNYVPDGMPEPGTTDTVDATVLQFPPRRDEVHVELLNVPLLLHAAWQQHAEGVLREFLLASMDLDDDGPLAQHAAATEALAVAAEQIPAPDVGVEPDELMAHAVDPDVSSPRIDLAVPQTSLPNFDVLDQTLDRATELAAQGRLLIPPTQPEMQMLRHWLCDQVRGQAANAVPTAWPPTEAFGRTGRAPLAWDDSPVIGSTEAQIAGDDSGCIIAVSPSALRLLGYDDDAELVGRRIITVIPNRYHQAHIAGFSLYLLNGRAPLLGRAVEVPVLRRDGTEVSVELRIEPHPQPNGRALFIAELRDLASGLGSASELAGS
jgi:PAS domain S-box-containing protein